jgi:hypothetical protein
MAIIGLTLDGISPTPLPQGPGTDGFATVSFNQDLLSPSLIEVFAVPEGGGAPILVGSGLSLALFSGTEDIDIETSSLDPSINYSFFAQDALTGLVTSNEVGPVDVTCFVEGTLISTERGQIAVEALRIGDLVVTMHGTPSLQPVVWIGHSRIAVAGRANPRKTAPILVRAGALMEGAPHRDLRVSPEHAFFLDGCLVPARLLVNGTTIVQELWCPEVTYWHVELETHGLLVSEGVVSESYFDDGNRQNFDNYGVAALVKDFESHRANGCYRQNACAPLIDEDSAALTRIRIRLASRADQPRNAARHVA